MKRILEEKKKYDEIEIPQELSSRVSAAIEQSKNRTKRGFEFYVKVLAAPVAVCAAICIAVGVNGIFVKTPIENDEKAVAEVTDDIAVAEMAKSSRMMPLNDSYKPTAGTERMNKAMEENAASVIYTDENYISLSSVDEEGNVKYLNFSQVSGEDVFLDDLGIEGYNKETPFYIASADTAVVIIDGAETKRYINRG